MFKWQSVFIAVLSCILMAVAPVQASGQVTSTNQQTSDARALRPKQRLPLSLAHLYWHFLMYQNHLDTKAAANAALGQDSSALRNHLQVDMGFSDQEFAQIHTSATRLAKTMAAFDASAVAIKSRPMTAASYAQLEYLSQNREMAVNAEISSIRQSLPPDRVQRLELFLTAFFAPTNAKPLAGSAVSVPSAAAGVR